MVSWRKIKPIVEGVLLGAILILLFAAISIYRKRGLEGEYKRVPIMEGEYKPPSWIKVIQNGIEGHFDENGTFIPKNNISN